MPTLNNNFVADTRGKYHQNTASLVQFIKKIGRVNVFLLLYKWPRLMTPKRVDQLQLYQQVFGKTWWSHVISQVNWWRHDRNSAHLRNRRNISEELVDKIMNENYTSLWNVSAEIPTTFVDPMTPIFSSHEIGKSERSLYLKHTQALWKNVLAKYDFSCSENCKIDILKDLSLIHI